MYKLLPLVLILLMLPTSGAAQWEKVSGNIMTRPTSHGTVITYREGDVWAGYRKVFYSSDEGETWVDRTPTSVLADDIIVDIDFFNRDIGIVLASNKTELDRLYYTMDRGLTWRESPHDYSYGASFLGSPDKLIMHGFPMHVSHDAGLTWTQHPVDGSAMGSAYLGDSKVAVFVSSSNHRSHLMLSTDDGLTWITKPGKADYDCYDIVYDSCNKILFVPNEEWWTQEDKVAEALISTDEGTSWTTVCNFPLPPSKDIAPITGGVAITSRAMYAHSGGNGVLRSIDKGSTWQSIGGPDGAVDARSIAVATDDLIFAIGSDGAIWRTRNAGGFPLAPIVSAENVILSLETLFTDSVLHACGETAIEEIPLEVAMCSPVSIASMSIEGEGKASYELLDTLLGPIQDKGNIRVVFAPRKSGHHTGLLRIVYDDGSSHVIPLAGIADLMPVSVSAMMSDVTIDTLGEAAEIELHIDPPDLAEDVTVYLSYDPALSYRNTIASDATLLHTAPASGSFSFVIPAEKLQSSEPDAIILFDNVTSLPKTEYQVRLDSVIVNPFAKNCFETLSLATSEITVPVACGTTLLSQLLRNEKIVITVNQYRDNDLLEIEASHAGHYSIALVDMLGNIVMTEIADIDHDTPARLHYRSLASGTYLVVVRGNNTVSSHRVQIQ